MTGWHAVGWLLFLTGVANPIRTEAGERSASVNYRLRCSGCHGEDGSGNEPADIPNLRDYVGAFTRDDDGRTYLLHVPGVINSNLSDSEISAVLNYVVEEWAGRSLADEFIRFTPSEVTSRRSRSVKDIVLLRRQIVVRLNQSGVRTSKYPWP
jgi:hypothetical protein